MDVNHNHRVDIIVLEQMLKEVNKDISDYDNRAARLMMEYEVANVMQDEEKIKELEEKFPIMREEKRYLRSKNKAISELLTKYKGEC